MNNNTIMITFTIFSLLSSYFVITTSNAIYSVLFLILVFCFNTIILLSLGSEFLALIFLIVYVGAIAVLFLFVVMMLNIKNTIKTNKLSKTDYIYLIIIFSIFFLFFFFFKEVINLKEYLTSLNDIKKTFYNFTYTEENISFNIDLLYNINVIGQLLYTYFFNYFLISGIILLQAMIGAIILTMTKHRKIKRQNIFSQVSRKFTNAIFLSKKAEKKNSILTGL